MKDVFQAAAHSARLLAGRRFYLLALVPLAWPAFLALLLLTNRDMETFRSASAQGTLIGLPLTVLAIFLGVRVIAGELDARRLELVYTVPGGARRVWWSKLLAALFVLLLAEAILAVVAAVFFTGYPLAALYGALQAAVFYLLLAMGMAVLFKSEVTGAMAAAGLLALNGFLTGFGGLQSRFSPFFNPEALGDVDATQVFAWTLQNRVGCLLAMAALVALAFGRAERRERMLSG